MAERLRIRRVANGVTILESALPLAAGRKKGLTHSEDERTSGMWPLAPDNLIRWGEPIIFPSTRRESRRESFP